MKIPVAIIPKLKLYGIIALVAIVVGLGVYWAGYAIGGAKARQAAAEQEVDRVAERERVLGVVAEAIEKQRPIYKNTVEKAETIVERETFYKDCKPEQSLVDLIDKARNP